MYCSVQVMNGQRKWVVDFWETAVRRVRLCCGSCRHRITQRCEATWTLRRANCCQLRRDHQFINKCNVWCTVMYLAHSQPMKHITLHRSSTRSEANVLRRLSAVGGAGRERTVDRSHCGFGYASVSGLGTVLKTQDRKCKTCKWKTIKENTRIGSCWQKHLSEQILNYKIFLLWRTKCKVTSLGLIHVVSF